MHKVYEPNNKTMYENIQKYDAKNLDYLLPEWIMNLKDYFKKNPDSDYSHTYS